MSPEQVAAAKNILFFNVVWSGIQILVAFMYIITICYVGIAVNETVSQHFTSLLLAHMVAKGLVKCKLYSTCLYDGVL